MAMVCARSVWMYTHPFDKRYAFSEQPFVIIAATHSNTAMPTWLRVLSTKQCDHPINVR